MNIDEIKKLITKIESEIIQMNDCVYIKLAIEQAEGLRQVLALNMAYEQIIKSF